MTKRLLIGTTIPNKLWILDRDTPEIIAFDPPLPAGVFGGGPPVVWGSPTGEIICTSGRASDSSVRRLHLEGGAWVDKGQAAGPGDGNHPVSIHGTDYSNVWAVDSSGNVSHFDGDSWTVDATLSSPGTCADVFALNATDVFIASHDGLWFRRSGDIGSGVWDNEIAQMATDTGITLGAGTDAYWVWAVSADEVYWGFALAWSTQCVLKWNGTTWSKSNNYTWHVPCGASVSGSAPNNLRWQGADGSSEVAVHNYDGVDTIGYELNGDPDWPLQDVWSCGDVERFTDDLWYAIGRNEAGGAGFSLWETDDDGVLWTRIVLQSESGLATTMGLGTLYSDLPPMLQNQSPSPGASEQPTDVTISGDVVDADGDLDPTTVKFWVNDTLAWLGSVAVVGWTGSRSAVANGFHYSFAPTADLLLPSGENTIRVYAEDAAGRVLDEEWSFSVTWARAVVDPADAAGEVDTGLDLKLASDTHDVLVADYDLVLVAGADEVAQHLLVALRLFLGEWYLDEYAGVPYYRNILVSAPNSRVIEGLFRQVILGDADIEELTEFAMDIDRATRKLDLDFTAVSRVGDVNVSAVFP